MDAFSRFGTNFTNARGAFFFDSEENEYAKVELEAVKLNDETARAELVRIWQQDVFRTPGTAWCSRTRPRPARHSKP